MLKKLFRLSSLLFFLLFLSVTSFALIDMRNANYTQSWTDLDYVGTGFRMRLERTYNSRSQFKGLFGYGWCTDFETKLFSDPNGDIRIKNCGAGKTVLFRKRNKLLSNRQDMIGQVLSKYQKTYPSTSTRELKKLKSKLTKSDHLLSTMIENLQMTSAASDGTYIAVGQIGETLTKTSTGFKRKLSDGSYQSFDAKGFIKGMYDRNKNYIKIQSLNGKITSVLDNSGKKLLFKYDANSGLVSSVKGYDGKTIYYKYSGDDLVSIKNTLGTYQISYKLHNITQIVFPNKKTEILNYDFDKDWVTSFKHQDGCKETYKYQADPKSPRDHYWSEVKKQCKGKIVNQSRYEFWYKLKRKSTDKYLARVLSEVNGYVKDISYHDIFGTPTRITDGPTKTYFTYFDSGLLKSKTVDKIRFSYDYNTSCQKVSQVSVENLNRAPSAKSQIINKAKSQFKYSSQTCDLVQASTSDGKAFIFEYDKSGRIRQIKDRARNVLALKYIKDSSQPARVYRKGIGQINIEYDKSGNVKNVFSPQGGQAALQVASTFNQALEVIAPATKNLGSI